MIQRLVASRPVNSVRQAREVLHHEEEKEEGVDNDSWGSFHNDGLLVLLKANRCSWLIRIIAELFPKRRTVQPPPDS